MKDTYERLLEKLDSFSRKYYQNQIIKGSIYFVGIGLSAFLISAILEYYGQFSSPVRTVLFFSLVVIFVVLFAKFIATPAARLLKLGKAISHEEASQIIGKHFPEINDKLLNTLQLKRQAVESKSETSLLEASIDQRINEMKPIEFGAAVDFKENRKYLRYALPSLLLGALLLIISPAIITDSTKRIVTYSTDYIPEAPFDFVVTNDKLEVPLNENFSLEVEARGDYVPNEMSIELDGKLFRMKPNKKGGFSYTFRNVRNPLSFQFFADGYYSDNYDLNVLPVPGIANFDIRLAYPDYLEKENETFHNSGNIEIPEGSYVEWKYKTENAEEMRLWFPDTAVVLAPEEKNRFTYKKRVFTDLQYRVAALNSIVGGKDTIGYRVKVIKDAHPRINVEEARDSLNQKRVFFAGTISDDYGLTKLEFHYVVTGEDGLQSKGKERIKISSSVAQEFYFSQNFDELKIIPGDQIDYYFEVWDNDGVNGAKSSKSSTMSFRAPTTSELDKERKESSKSVKEDLEKNLKEAAELQKELREINENLLQKNEMSWQDKKQVEDALKKQKELEKNVNQLKEKQQKSQKQQENYMQQSQEMIQKQEQIQKLFDELMSDEMKELYEKLEELMKQMDQEKVREELENMEMSSEELEKELDRTLELFKEMEFEQEFERSMEKLEELAKKQEELSKETGEKDTPKEELKEKQEELDKQFEEVKEDLKALEELNEELQDPNDMPDTKEMEESIEQSMDDAKENIEKNKNKKASESQQDASEEMQEMADKMNASMQSQSSEKAQEDMEDLRSLLENIVQLSFDQEEIMDELKEVERDDPRYVELGQKQKKLEDDSKMVEDSLFALSKRVPQIESIVNKEIGQINQSIEKALDDIGERRTAKATSRQQYAMTSYNNLALLLDEALQQMQMAMANEMPGTGNCEKPGGKGKKPSEGKMSKMQEEMGKKLDEMKKAMEKGKKPGGSKPGMGDQGMSKEIAKMAAEQAAIRKEIEKMAQKLNEQGKGEGKGLEDIAEEMEQNEEDLVNQEITRETLKRQQDILTRLLESEKAEREREYDEKRESNSPDSFEPSNPEQYLEYNRRKAREVELLRTVPPDLKPYYKDRVNDYFLNFEN
ncbi:MAG: hypothetical protein ABR574_03755 [Cryomorphaceae bacterium]|nr:hypothetical protein [Flavobacteriales bacterium]